MVQYAAFLRGINVGGHKPLKMDDLKKALEPLAFKNVKTILASGNVLFETGQTKPDVLAKKIGDKLENAFGHKIGVLIRSIKELERLAAENPFRKITVTPHTRLYVTFLSDKPVSKLKIPYSSPNGDFKIIRVSEGEVCSVTVLSPTFQTTDLMNVVEKEFGKNVTTRNWNTIAKILKA